MPGRDSDGSDRPARRRYDDAEHLPIDPDLSPEDPGEPAICHHRGIHVNRTRDFGVLGAIAAGGFAGTLARYSVGLAWPSASGRFPWSIFTINASGSFLLGLLVTILLRRARPDRYLRPLLCVGVLGSWTTMSSLAVGSDLLVRAHHTGTAVIYVFVTVVVGLILTWSGIGAVRFVEARGLSWSSR